MVAAARALRVLHLAQQRVLLIEDARRGLADIAAGRTQDADAGIAAMQSRRSSAQPAGTKGKVKTSATARKRD